MSSYLEKQQAAFKGDLKSAAPKVISTKRVLATPSLPSAVPSPSPSESTQGNGTTKRKREAPAGVWSQPQETGVGNEINTQVMYAIDYLKRKDEPKSIHEVLDHMNMHNADEHRKKMIVQILRNHPKAQWYAEGGGSGSSGGSARAWDSGKYAHRSTLAVRNGADLVAYLQQRPDAMGVKVSDIKDGWPECEATIERLEREHQILATRTKKDNKARMVWSNDATLYHTVDDEFRIMWQQMELPGVDELVRKLQDAGQKPASEDPAKRVKAPPVQAARKRKAARKGGKMTNTHIAHLLKPLVRK